MFQLSKCFSFFRAELTGIHEMFLTTRSALLVASPVASDSREEQVKFCTNTTNPICYSGNCSCILSEMRQDLAHVILSWVFRRLVHLFVNRVSLQQKKNSIQTTSHPEGAVVVRITDEKAEKCQKWHSGR